MSDYQAIKKAIKKTNFYAIVEKIKYFYLEKSILNSFIFYIAKNKEDLNDLFKLRYKVFCLEKKYLDYKKYPNGLETDIYDKYAVHFVARDKKDYTLAGGIRLIKHSNFGFPMEKSFSFDIGGKKLINEKIVEVSRLIVMPKYRKKNIGKHSVLMGLLKSAYHYSKRNNYEYWVAAIDYYVFNLLKKFGFTFEILGRSKKYMGSESIPVLIDIKNEVQWLKVINHGLYKFFENNKSNFY